MEEEVAAEAPLLGADRTAQAATRRAAPVGPLTTIGCSGFAHSPRRCSSAAAASRASITSAAAGIKASSRDGDKGVYVQFGRRWDYCVPNTVVIEGGR